MPRLPHQLLLGFLLPVMALLAVDWLIILPVAAEERLGSAFAIALIVLPKAVALPWLGARLMRFAEGHFARHGNGVVKTGLFAGLLVAVLVLLVGAIEAAQSVLYAARVRDQAAPVAAPAYHLRENRASREYTISGPIDFGISRDFDAFIEAHPGGTRVILDSVGGSIYEGRGLLALFARRELDTHVVAECSSACVLAFLGGRRRTMAPGARLGFHQYAMDYAHLNQALPFYSAEAEQKRDGELMRQSGISAQFVARVFDQPNAQMWYPDPARLLRAGVVDAIE